MNYILKKYEGVGNETRVSEVDKGGLYEMYKKTRQTHRTVFLV